MEARLGERFFLCTQNVDNLHERAGSRRLVHMHGELFVSRCEDWGSGVWGCGREPFSDEGVYETAAAIPQCACGGRIRPHIVWFGETPLEMERIEREIARATVMLVVGTSGAVYPAASFVQWAQPGTRKIYVGPEEPMNAGAFTRIVLGRAGVALPKLIGY